MNVYAGLLFQQGHIQDPKLALSLAGAADRDDVPDAGAAPASARVAPATDPAACKPYRRGAVRDWCSVALSPFR